MVTYDQYSEPDFFQDDPELATETGSAAKVGFGRRLLRRKQKNT